MLKFAEIIKSFDGFSLGPISLEIHKGEYFVILGPSGAGKTVFLELIAGIISLADGKMTIDDKDIALVPPEKREMALVYQDSALFPCMDVRENISFGLKVRGASKSSIDKEVKAVCEFLEIGHIMDRGVARLSGGEKQRVALARSLVLKPKVLLLDEPMGSLDTPVREHLRRELKMIHKHTGATFVHVTHDFEEAVYLADKIAIMRGGAIVQVGTPEEVMRFPKNEFVADFVGVKNILSGNVKQDGQGLKYFESGRLQMIVTTPIEGQCQASIPAEDILISREAFVSSARNSLPCAVAAILPRGRINEVVVDVAGIELAALITRQSVEDLELAVGKHAWATFKTSAVHVF